MAKQKFSLSEEGQIWAQNEFSRLGTYRQYLAAIGDDKLAPELAVKRNEVLLKCRALDAAMDMAVKDIVDSELRSKTREKLERCLAIETSSRITLILDKEIAMRVEDAMLYAAANLVPEIGEKLYGKPWKYEMPKSKKENNSKKKSKRRK